MLAFGIAIGGLIMFIGIVTGFAMGQIAVNKKDAS